MPPVAERVAIDMDPGVDDALALFVALASPELDVVGLTTVFGNAGVDVTTRNALILLDAAGRSDLPVIRGAAGPLASGYLGPVAHVHGANGLGDAPLQPPSRPSDPGEAAYWLHARAAERPGTLTVLALGPLTNLAEALRRHPGLPGIVRRVVVMGGNALGPGNATPAAEANVLNDPEAADAVFGAPWLVTMVGLDVTHRVNLRGADVDRVTAGARATHRLLAGALPLYRAFFERTNGTDGFYLHDPSAVAYLVRPDLFETSRWPVRVETEGFSRGKTWPSLGDTDDASPLPWRGRPRVSVCTGVDGPGVVDLVVSRLL